MYNNRMRAAWQDTGGMKTSDRRRSAGRLDTMSHWLEKLRFGEYGKAGRMIHGIPRFATHGPAIVKENFSFMT